MATKLEKAIEAARKKSVPILELEMDKLANGQIRVELESLDVTLILWALKAVRSRATEIYKENSATYADKTKKVEERARAYVMAMQALQVIDQLAEVLVEDPGKKGSFTLDPEGISDYSPTWGQYGKLLRRTISSWDSSGSSKKDQPEDEDEEEPELPKLG
ncbi:hypothetical protein C4561_03280 [candidate division WWE3 bacterium]|jgi:hypothetical protein|uniref:Uncharacterized protein n=1 Tax=candidate division WWE3 bacterium TaxID=2053526 RepID=A0A3A4ZKT0_UNCKA|nr:MAG: hypothetical protein C4561_03280 [candidate division WWE3 bacterium]